MSIVSTGNGGFTIDGKEDMQIFRLLTLRAGLELEATTGMRMSRGRSCYAITKAEYGFKGNKHRVLEQLNAVVDAVKQARNNQEED